MRVQILAFDGKHILCDDREVYSRNLVTLKISLQDYQFYYIVDGKVYDIKINSHRWK